MRWAVLSAILLLLTVSAAPAAANHEPLYKQGLDRLPPGAWEAHFVWLRNPVFNFLGEVWWRFKVLDGQGVDVLFLEWDEFQNFRDGLRYAALTPPLGAVREGAQWADELTDERPYVLLFRNPGAGDVVVLWQIMAELDWRRWQSQPPGPVLDLTLHRVSPTLDPGANWTLSLPHRGLYLVRGQSHVDMTSLVEVVGQGVPESLAVTVRDQGFHPEIVRVPAGSSLQWTNLDRDPLEIEVLRVNDLDPTEPRSPGPSPWLLAWAPGLLLFLAVGLRLARRRRD